MSSRLSKLAAIVRPISAALPFLVIVLLRDIIIPCEYLRIVNERKQGGFFVVTTTGRVRRDYHVFRRNYNSVGRELFDYV